MIKLKSILASTLSVFFLAATVAGSASALPPDHALNAITDSGTGCEVSATGSGHVTDPTCQWNIVRRRNADGQVVVFSYHDEGQLQPGQTAPSRAVHFSGICAGGRGEYTETISPSGHYRSDCRFNRSND